MPYELDPLTRLITGDLSPASFHPAEPAFHRDFLRQRFHTYRRHFKIQYCSSAEPEFCYQHHEEFAFLELNELPRLSATSPTAADSRTLGLLLADALPRLGLSLPEMQDATCQLIGQQLFLELAAASSLDALPAPKARYFYYHTQLLDEAARLRRDLPERALQCPDAAAVGLFVRHYQQALQNLLTHARAQLDPARWPGYYGPVRDYSPADVYQFQYSELEKLLAYVEQTFPEHLNLATPLSYRRRVQALTDVQIPLAAVLQALHGADDIPARLRELVCDCLSRLLITVQDATLSYQDLLYPRLLLRELHGRLQRGWPLTAQNLAGLLVRYNFNSLAFLGLVTAHLRGEAAAAADDHPADRLPVVLLHLKLYRQLQPATELRYVPTLPPLRTQLISWLKEERDYLRHQVREAITPAGRPAEVARLLTPLSVAQLAQLFRALHEAGVFGDTNHREVFRLLAANFRTPRQEHISEKSLADKFYNAEDSTRQVVQEIARKMRDYLQQASAVGLLWLSDSLPDWLAASAG